jgi:hypothetical protein
MRVAQMHVQCSWGAIPIGGVDEADVFRALPEEAFRPPPRRKRRAARRRSVLIGRALNYVSALLADS